jgi:hypothetical protein
MKLISLYFNTPFTSATIMPKSYLKEKTPPKQPSAGWLAWPISEFEANIAKEGSSIAGIMGINKAGDLQSFFMPKIVPRAFSDDDAAIIGNSTDLHSKPCFIFTDTSDLGLVAVIENLSDIPNEICPKEHLSSKFLKSTSWDKAKVPLGLALVPIIAPIYFGQKHIEININDANFEDKLESFSPKHLQWEKLIKEHMQQEENDGKDVDTIINRLFGRTRGTGPSKNSKFALAGFVEAQIPESLFFPIYNLPKDKWKDHQSKLGIFLWEIQAPIVSPVLQPQALVLALFPLDPLLPLPPSIFRSSSIQLKLLILLRSCSKSTP